MERETQSPGAPWEKPLPAPFAPSMPPGFAECLSVVERLPEVFGGNAGRALFNDLSASDTHHLYLVNEENQVAGFALVFRKSEDVVELVWLAVDPKFQRRGIGRKLIEKISAELVVPAPSPPRVLMARSFRDPSRGIEGASAKPFFDKTGFLLVDTIETALPDEPSSPCEIYVKILH